MSILTRIFEGRRKSISFSEQEQYEEGSDHEENADGKNGCANDRHKQKGDPCRRGSVAVIQQ